MHIKINDLTKVWYLKINHGKDFFTPLNEKSSTDVQVEVGETF